MLPEGRPVEQSTMWGGFLTFVGALLMGIGSFMFRDLNSRVRVLETAHTSLLGTLSAIQATSESNHEMLTYLRDRQDGEKWRAQRTSHD